MRIQIHYRNNKKTDTFYCCMEFIKHLNKSHISRAKIKKYTYAFAGFDYESKPASIVVVKAKDNQ